MRRALIACGGTGGHLAPGIALAEELLSRGWECKLLISGKQVDSMLVQKYTQFKYEAIAGSGLSFHPVKFFRFLRDLLDGYRSCGRIIRSSGPELVVGFGGFISASALLAGARNGVPVAIHEANQIPGRVTRLTSRFASRVYLPNGVVLKEAKKDCIRNVGMPLRTEFERRSKGEAKRVLGFDPDKKLLLVFGGSQGALALNEWAKQHSRILNENQIQLLCLTGMSGGCSESAIIDSDEAAQSKTIFMEFSEQMAILLSAADLAISRAGAGSIAEFIRCRVPAILVPYPHAADNHQLFNAQRFVTQGGGVLCRQEEMKSLLNIALDVISSDEKRNRLMENLEAMDQSNSQSEIADDLERLATTTKDGQKEALEVT